MRCEEARKNLPLFLYGELSFDEEEQVEIAHRRMRRVPRGAGAREGDVCRAGCRRAGSERRGAGRIASRIAQPRWPWPHDGALGSGAGFWDKFREGFTIHFHFAPGIAQVAGAAGDAGAGIFDGAHGARTHSSALGIRRE